MPKKFREEFKRDVVRALAQLRRTNLGGLIHEYRMVA